MKKIKLIIAAVAMLSLVSGSAAYADGFAAGEGLYVGGFAGFAAGVAQPKVTSSAAQTEDTSGTFEAAEGGLGLMGFEGGVNFGYGYKMGDFYAGLEGESAWGDVEFKLTSSVGINIGSSILNSNTAANDGITEVTAKKDWTSGAFGRVGYYLNPSSLLSFRGGILASKFDVSYNGNQSQSETYYAGGPSFGVDLSSNVAALDPNLSVRIGAVYTKFLTAPISGIGTNVGSGDSFHDSEITGEALSARVGMQYSFFDANSLFNLF